MNYRKGQPRPQLVALKLEPAEYNIVCHLQQAMRLRTPQAAVTEAIRRYWTIRDRTQDEQCENIEYKQLYFELAEQTALLRFTAEQLINQLDEAELRTESHETGLPRGKSRRPRLANVRNATST